MPPSTPSSDGDSTALNRYANSILFEHANDAVGYIFTDMAAREGGYEVCRASLSESMERAPYLAAAGKALRG